MHRSTHYIYLHRDLDALPVTTNEAYNVVKQNRGATEPEYETVFATTQTFQPPGGEYETV